MKGKNVLQEITKIKNVRVSIHVRSEKKMNEERKERKEKKKNETTSFSHTHTTHTRSLQSHNVT
jgi:hypothetical protein